MHFTETRGNDGSREPRVSFSAALMSPIASFGGIYSPEKLPSIDHSFIESHLQSTYAELALDLLRLMKIDIADETMISALELYGKFDDPENPVPVVKYSENTYISELYHGPTRAFKDMALQPFGVLLSSLAQQRDQEYLILTATSGDTGPAALDTFRNRKNIRVACLYPDGGTSDVQRLQMVTESAPNLKIIGIEGNFDDAQSALKSLLSSTSFNEQLASLGISLSAANSVNFGRIIFQMIYQFHNYLELLRQQRIAVGDDIIVHIPSGNFGNALGAYFARQMGLPISRIVIASNANNVLTEWVQTGRYDMASRNLIKTTSPAMDILKSSNVERILFDLFGAARTAELMRELDDNGHYQLNETELAQIQTIFSADECSDEEGRGYIKAAFEQGYLLDPHTATCFKNCQRNEYSNQVNLICSTAEWTKFAPVIASAISGETFTDDLPALQSIANAAGIPIPDSIKNLFTLPVKHDVVVAKNEIEAEISKFLQQ